MSIRDDWPICLDPVHKSPAPISPAGPAVAVVRRQYAHSQWTMRCTDCVARVIEAFADHPTAHASIVYLRTDGGS